MDTDDDDTDDVCMKMGDAEDMNKIECILIYILNRESIDLHYMKLESVVINEWEIGGDK